MILTTSETHSFTLQTKNTSDIAIVWSQGPVPEKGLRSKSADAILCSTQSGCSNAASLPSIAIDNPGEYEFKGIFVIGVQCSLVGSEHGVLFAVDTEGVRMMLVPYTIQEKLSQELYAQIGSVDILVLSTTNESISIAADIVSQTEPRMVITNESAGTAAFIKKIGLQAERVSKLKLSKKDLPQEHTACYILTNEQ